MLFIESRIAELKVEKSLRTDVLEALQERGFVPLIRASRLHFFELAGAERVKELEQSVAQWSDREGDVPYVRGDVFCSDDIAHFIIFGDEQDDGAGLRAGVVYVAETDDPAHKLDAFCRHVQEALEAASRAARTPGAQAADTNGGGQGIVWRASDNHPPETFAGFAGAGGGDAPASSTSARGAKSPERARAVELLEDAGARDFLQRLSEAHADGRVTEMLAAVGVQPAQEALVTQLAGAGLVRREVQVSCRKAGRSIFRLPSPDALAIVTASNAVCSECGSAVADERAEELITPTQLAHTMLKDGAWLVSSLRSILAEIGVPERETAARPANAESEAQMLANVCGAPFLFVLHDGDFNAAQARRALDAEAEARTSHLVVLATGKIQDEARARIRDHARRRSRSGGETQALFIEGLDNAAVELRRVVERVSQETLTRELYELDASAGFNVGYALAARFRLLQKKGRLQDPAASAAGAAAGGLNEV